MIFLYPRKLDLEGSKESFEVYINQKTADDYGIKEGDLVVIYPKDVELGGIVVITDTLVEEGQIGLPRNIWEKYKISQVDPLPVELKGQAESVQHIRKKILGGKLSYSEAYQIMDDIVKRKLTPVEMTYFAATSYNPGFDMDEIYYLTKAMVETGEKLDFSDITSMRLDKHSIGGIPAKGVTPIIVSMLSALGFYLPNTSSRAITSPAGTSDVLEVLMPVALDPEKIREVVLHERACMVWGGALNLAPADDILIQIEKPLHIESYDKFVISIMAKKIAMGITHQLIDVPYGKYAKVPYEDVEKVKQMFKDIASRFDIKLTVYTRESFGADGQGIGPVLEARDILWILERDPKRPKGIENLAIDMASELLVLSGEYSKEAALVKLREVLETKKALEKFWKIAIAQGAEYRVKGDDLEPGPYSKDVFINKSGTIKGFDNRQIVRLTRALGAPYSKRAGIYLHYFVDEQVKAGDIVATLFAENINRLALAEKILTDIDDSWIEVV